MSNPMREALPSWLPLAQQLDLIADPASWRSMPVAADTAPALALMLARRGRTDPAREILPGLAEVELPAPVSIVAAYAWLVAGLPPHGARQILPGKLCPAGEAVAILAYQMTGFPPFPPLGAATARMIEILADPEPDFAGVAQALKAIPPRPAPPLDGIFWTAWADIMRQANRFRLALGCLRQLVETTDATIDACMTYAAGCLRQGRTGDITVVWEKLPEPARDVPWSRLLEVATLLPTTRLRHAVTMAGRLADELPGDWMVQAALGYAATLAGSDDALHDHCASYLANGSRHAAMAFVRGNGGALLTRAERALSQVATHCASPAAWNDLGHHHAVAGNLEQAELAFRKALSLDPQQRHAVINLPLILLRQGRRDEAQAHVATAVFLADPPPAILALSRDPTFRSRSGPESLEWKRSTVFSYHWRAALADRLESDAAGPLPGTRS